MSRDADGVPASMGCKHSWVLHPSVPTLAPNRQSPSPGQVVLFVNQTICCFTSLPRVSNKAGEFKEHLGSWSR